MKQYSLSYWIKQKLQFVSKPEEVIAEALRRHFDTPNESDIAYYQSPLEMINAMYLEWKKRGTVHHCLFPTPLTIAEQLARFATVRTGEVVFDPGAGFGNLLFAAENCGAEAFGCEFQEWIPRLIAPVVNLDIRRGDFLDGFTPPAFDVVLTNPPFGKGYQREGDLADLTTAFFDRLADLCTEGQRIAAILPRGFVDKERPKALVETFARFEITSRLSLPDGTFKPLTEVSTEMVLLQPIVSSPRPSVSSPERFVSAPARFVPEPAFTDLPLWIQSQP